MATNLVADIRRRYQVVVDGIAAAAGRSGRRPEDVRLVVVSKSQPLEVIQAAIEAGITRLGENYAEEALAKMQAFKDPHLEWHMIGHVQSRKADIVAGNFSMLHSLDSLKLAGKLEQACFQSGKMLPVLLEFNVSGEASKFGFQAWDDTRWPALAESLLPLIEMKHLVIQGLMTMPPYFEDPERTRPFFRKLRLLQTHLMGFLPQLDWHELSMGTSIDHPAAVEEGATLVRVGQAILGARQQG